MKALLKILFGTGALIACGSSDVGNVGEAAKMPASRGEMIFNSHCTLCHGEDGKLGIGGAKDLTASILTKEEIIAVITAGRGTMMPFNTILSKDEIEAVADHVLNLGKSE